MLAKIMQCRQESKFKYSKFIRTDIFNTLNSVKYKRQHIPETEYTV